MAHHIHIFSILYFIDHIVYRSSINNFTSNVGILKYKVFFVRPIVRLTFFLTLLSFFHWFMLKIWVFFELSPVLFTEFSCSAAWKHGFVFLERNTKNQYLYCPDKNIVSFANYQFLLIIQM